MLAPIFPFYPLKNFVLSLSYICLGKVLNSLHSLDFLSQSRDRLAKMNCPRRPSTMAYPTSSPNYYWAHCTKVLSPDSPYSWSKCPQLPVELLLQKTPHRPIIFIHFTYPWLLPDHPLQPHYLPYRWLYARPEFNYDIREPSLLHEIDWKWEFDLQRLCIIHRTLLLLEILHFQQEFQNSFRPLLFLRDQNWSLWARRPLQSCFGKSSCTHF